MPEMPHRPEGGASCLATVYWLDGEISGAGFEAGFGAESAAGKGD
ncbi:MAG: hypothetical protein ACR2N0_14685 [Rubrobacteraceae bacterium]|jgi:hypothetical protein